MNIAVFIDAENIGPSHAAEILDKAVTLGSVRIVRAYGDFGSMPARPWTKATKSHAIRLVQQTNYRKGKSLADMALIIDALDVFHSNAADGFFLASTDGDFAPLCLYLKERGVPVYGFGRDEAPDMFKAACKKFFVIKDGRPTKDEPGKPAPASDSAKPVDELLRLIDEAIESKKEKFGDMPFLSAVGAALHKAYPDFSPRSYGRELLSSVIKDHPDRYVLEGKGPKTRIGKKNG